jgi:hypothetical protein
VRERNISEIAEIVSDAEPRWSEMANAARRAWKDWFSDEVLFDRIGDALTAITKERTTPESLVQRFPSILEWDWRLRRGIQYSRSCLSLSRSVQRRNSLVENQKIVASHVTRVSE